MTARRLAAARRRLAGLRQAPPRAVPPVVYARGIAPVPRFPAAWSAQTAAEKQLNPTTTSSRSSATGGRVAAAHYPTRFSAAHSSLPSCARQGLRGEVVAGQGVTGHHQHPTD